MKRILSLLCCVLCVCTVLCGCAQAQQEPKSESHALSSEQENTLAENNTKTSSASVPFSEEEQNTQINSSSQNSSSAAQESGAYDENAEQYIDNYRQGQQDYQYEENNGEVVSSPNAGSSAGGSSNKNSASSKLDGSGAGQSSSPVNKPKPTEPPKDPNVITVTLSVDCLTAFNQGDEIAQVVSENGYILSQATLEIKTGSSVYDLLKESGLVIAASSSPMGVYVSSIQSLAEKACGNKSGWQYQVNGEHVSFSCDKCILQDGDTVAWRYTCNGGKDIS